MGRERKGGELLSVGKMRMEEVDDEMMKRKRDWEMVDLLEGGAKGWVVLTEERFQVSEEVEGSRRRRELG